MRIGGVKKKYINIFQRRWLTDSNTPVIKKRIIKVAEIHLKPADQE